MRTRLHPGLWGIALALPLLLSPHSQPALIRDHVPRQLSETGIFTSLTALTPAAGWLAYAVNAPLWSDGAHKQRWMALPPGAHIDFSPTGAWHFPPGTWFAKTFSLSVDEQHPTYVRRLETRLLLCEETGIYGVTYRWREDQLDADLLNHDAGPGMDEDIPIRTASGALRNQRWHYPSRSECRQCHTSAAGLILGVQTRQLNRPLANDGHGINQLNAWSHAGLFAQPPADQAIAGFARLSAIDDLQASLEQRVRSYLDVNCAHCHQPGAVGFALFDGRFDTPLAEQNLIRGHVIIDHGIDRARYLVPQDPWRSMLLIRMETDAELRMPPLARNVVDSQATTAMRQWLHSLPGKPALPPPTIIPSGGAFSAPVEVTLTTPNQEATIRYTLDGSLPDSDSSIYTQPLPLTPPLTIRAAAFCSGFNPSVSVHATFTAAVQKP